jgi:carboxylesterase
MGSIDFLKQLEEDKAEFQTYYAGSNGVGIFFIHGFGSTPQESVLFLKYLASKGYAISSPILKKCSSLDNVRDINNASPEEWLEEAKKHFKKFSEDNQIKKIVLVGLSFGGSLAISIAKDKPEKVRGLITLETPIFFSPKISISLRVLRPLFLLIKKEFVRKTSILYRKGYKKSINNEGVVSLIPIKVVGKIFRYINFKTKNELKNIDSPFLIVQAAKSDLLNPKSADYIYQNIKSDKKEIYLLPVDNHDLNLLDEQGKILMMEKIENFIESLS